MKGLIKIQAVLLTLTAIFSGFAYGQIPQLINYQGMLINPSRGQPVPDDTYSITFSIYDVASGGSPVWTEIQNVTTKNGLYSVLLGSSTALTTTILSGPEKYLGIKVGDDPEMTPRKRIVSVAYAIVSEHANSVSWDSLKNVPEGFADGVDNTSGGGAGWVDDGTIVRLETNGDSVKIGSHIGPPGERGKLDVAGKIRSTSEIIAECMAFPYYGRSIRMKANEDQSLIATNNLYLDYNGSLCFRKDGSEKMRINTDGNVGIGIEPPAEKLHVGGNIKAEESVFAPNGIGFFRGLELSQYLVVDGNVAIGTTAPDSGQLHVETNSLYAGYFVSDGSSDNTQVIHAEYTGTNNYDAIAIYGKSKPVDYYGYGGYFVGGHAGVYGEVHPNAPSQTDKVYWGVRGRVLGGNGEASGVDGYAAATYVNYGVSGLAEGGFDNRGVRGIARGTSRNYGVWGYASNGTENWAGYFLGNVRVTGQINPAMSSFKIDHPTDPGSKYLSHSSVESPDMMNIYNGNITLDAKGEAWVELPEWFEALNKDFRYQLTCIGGFAPVYIANKISNNRFKIAGGTPGIEVSWQVTGIRQDAFANVHRIPVEEDKSGDDRGKYLHPKEYGVSETMGIGYDAKLKEEHK